MDEAKQLYMTLKKNKDLKTLFISMTGDWNKDKDAFTKQFNKNQELIDDFVSEETGDVPELGS